MEAKPRQIEKLGGYHRSIMNAGEVPQGVKTAEGWVCPLCPHLVQQYRYLIKRHMNLHIKCVAQYGGYSIYICKLQCNGQAKQSHYHCPYCKSVQNVRKERFIGHMKKCDLNPDGEKPQRKSRCKSIVKLEKRDIGASGAEGVQGGDADQHRDDPIECPVCLEKFPGSLLLDHLRSHAGVDVRVIPSKLKKTTEHEESQDIEEREVEVEEEMEEEFAQSEFLAETETVSPSQPSDDDELATIRTAVRDMTQSTAKTPEKDVRKSLRKGSVRPRSKSQARFVEVPPELIQTLKEASANVKAKGERRELMVWAETVVMRMERLSERQRAAFRMNVETHLMKTLYGAFGNDGDTDTGGE